jgi:hypothetical protein
MYYAAGCSDVLWEPGRQFAAPHRLDAVLRIFMLNATCNATCATAKVVAIATDHAKGKGVWGKHRELWPANLTLKVQAACAQTLRAMDQPACPFRKQSVAMALAGSDIYDFEMAFLLWKAGFDSLRLTFQPKGGQNPNLK